MLYEFMQHGHLDLGYRFTSRTTGGGARFVTFPGFEGLEGCS